MTRVLKPRVLIAPDKFRGSLTASQAAEAISVGILRAVPSAEIVLHPLADGGEGMVRALVEAGAQPSTFRARGPLGAALDAELAVLGSSVYIESALVCGLDLIDPTPKSALEATSAGLGDALRAAAGIAGITRIVVGLGGTATTDGGAGALEALGFTFLDADDRAIDLASLDTIWRVRRPEGAVIFEGIKISVATDVDSPLLGSGGAARVFSPQKGADNATVDRLERRMTAWSHALERSFGLPVAEVPGGGAAGGIAAGLYAALGGTIVSGATLMLDLLGVPQDVRRSDIVITGEGALDHQSLQGKLPVRVAALADSAKIPVWAIVGRAEGPDLPFDRIVQVVEGAGGRHPFHDAAAIVADLAESLGAEWSDMMWNGDLLASG